MTVNDILLKLWTNTKGSEFERRDEKRLWLLLQNFVESSGGLHVRADRHDVRGGTKDLRDIKPKPPFPAKIKAKLKQVFDPPMMG